MSRKISKITLLAAMMLLIPQQSFGGFNVTEYIPGFKFLGWFSTPTEVEEFETDFLKIKKGTINKKKVDELINGAEELLENENTAYQKGEELKLRNEIKTLKDLWNGFADYNLPGSKNARIESNTKLAWIKNKTGWCNAGLAVGTGLAGYAFYKWCPNNWIPNEWLAIMGESLISKLFKKSTNQLIKKVAENLPENSETSVDTTDKSETTVDTPENSETSVEFAENAETSNDTTDNSEANVNTQENFGYQPTVGQVKCVLSFLIPLYFAGRTAYIANDACTQRANFKNAVTNKHVSLDGLEKNLEKNPKIIKAYNDLDNTCNTIDGRSTEDDD